MSASAEQLPQTPKYLPLYLVETEPQPVAQLVPEMAEDQFTRQQAARFIGSVLADKTLKREQVPRKGPQNFMEAIHRAAVGDPEARKMVRINAETDALERSIKAGLITKVELSADEQGEIAQFGQDTDSIQANSLRYASADPRMLERTKAETRNSFRTKMLLKQGLLKDNWLVVFSRTADDMTNHELKENNFFTETMSCSIQASTENGSSAELITETGFVAGGNTEERHDAESVVSIGAKVDVDFSGKTATQILDMPILIPKELMPNGVIDLVKLWDDIRGGTFFGEDKPRQDYEDFAKNCKQRQASFQAKVDQIVEQLLREADSIKTPLQATKRLNKISEERMVEHAVKDHSINPQVFGPAAPHIIQARLYEQQGNHSAALTEQNTAKSIARSSSCPSSMQKVSSEVDVNGNKIEKDSSQASDSKTGKINCIKCRKSVNKAEVVKPSSWRCPKCNYEVDICNGREINPSKPNKEKDLKNVISLEEKRRHKQAQIKSRLAKAALQVEARSIQIATVA